MTNDTHPVIGIFRHAQAESEGDEFLRPLTPYGMAEFVRITIGTVAENERLLEATREITQSSQASVQL